MIIAAIKGNLVLWYQRSKDYVCLQQSLNAGLGQLISLPKAVQPLPIEEQ